MSQLALGIEPPKMWQHVPIEDPRARALADRHYSRQTVGAKGFVGPGQRFVLWHESELGQAVWAVCRALDPIGVMQWRNTIFRKESRHVASEMIIEATRETYGLWRRRYGGLPAERLTTEIDIEATAARRSRRHPPGYSYLCAGWEILREVPAGHGRSAKVVLGAPPPVLAAK